jgi:magnesium-transporting ATPase (P-type)
MGVEYNTERSLYKIELKYPFSSARKRMSVITDFNGHKCLFIKGASEIIL